MSMIPTAWADGKLVLARLLAFVALAGGVYLSVSHPLAPWAAVLVFLIVCALLMRAARDAVLCLPAALPLLSLAPWTGWRMVDEFDLLVLAVVAVGYAQAVRDRRANALRGWGVVLGMLVLATVAGGLWPAHGGYADDAALGEGWRVAKSVVWSVLLFPLVRAHVRAEAPHRAGARFFAACVAGAVAVCAAVIWERALYPGGFDFSTPYRTVALFWEMHRGGAALDVYLVLLAPIVVWAWRTTRRPSGRAAVAAFVLAFVYAVLTSFSRGVWGAALGALSVLAVLSVRRRRQRGDATVRLYGRADIALLVAVVLEVALVLGTGQFMGQRLANAGNDLLGRWQHWRSGLEVLQTPQDWAFGVGPGQLPRRWLGVPDAPRRSGGLQWRNDGSAGRVLLSGPDAFDGTPDGAYFLTQRIPADVQAPYRVQLEARSERTAEVDAQLCIQHLLYPAACRRTVLRIEAGAWQNVDGLIGGALAKGCTWLCAGRGVFMLAVRTPQATVELRRVSFGDADGEVLRNPRFVDGTAFWYPLARGNFQPWHIDNLYLEVLIEAGLIGLLLFFAVLFAVVRRVWHAYLGGDPLAAYYLASISALLALGLVVSVFDMPRVATLFGLFLSWAWFDAANAKNDHRRCRVNAGNVAVDRNAPGTVA